MAEYRLSPRAQDDLDQIFDYSVAQWGLPQALRYTDIIEAACLALAEDRLFAQNCAALRAGYWRRTVEQHVIYFRRIPDGIAVIRILHQKMDASRHF
jgi:toxin ParE1/3/4